MTDLAPTTRSPLDDRIRYAKALAEASLLPSSYRKQPANVLMAMEYGEALGLSPIAAIQGIHVIDGKPTASAQLIGALVRKAGHRLRVQVADDGTSARATIVRSDDLGFEFTSTWSLERAQAAGLLGKGTWKQYPTNLLKARAITEVARDACPEVLSGVAYTAEELGSTDTTQPAPEVVWEITGHDEPDGPDAIVIEPDLEQPAVTGRVEEARRAAGTYPTPSGRKNRGDQPATARQLETIEKIAQRDGGYETLTEFLEQDGATILDGVIYTPEQLTNAHMQVLFDAFGEYTRTVKP